MMEILLLAAILILFVYGYHIMGKLDRFLAGKHDSIEDTSEVVDPSCVMLTEDMPEERILDEIRLFRKKHKHTQIILFDDSSPLQNFKIPVKTE